MLRKAIIFMFFLSVVACSDTGNFAGSSNSKKKVSDKDIDTIKSDKDIDTIQMETTEEGTSSSSIFKNTEKVDGKYRIVVIQHETHAANFPHEIPTLTRIINEVSREKNIPLALETIHHNELTFEKVKNAAIVVWNDNSYSTEGITLDNVNTYLQVYDEGTPLYFIGDDLGNAIRINSFPVEWQNLIHLKPSKNGHAGNSIVIANDTHKIIDGPFGKVADFNYELDSDPAISTNTGEVVLLEDSKGHAICLAVEADEAEGHARVVTQNVLIYGKTSSVEREKLAKNAFWWLVEGLANSEEE